MRYKEAIKWLEERGIKRNYRQLKWMVDHKQIPHVQISERIVEFRACSLQKWLEKKEVIPL